MEELHFVPAKDCCFGGKMRCWQPVATCAGLCGVPFMLARGRLYMSLTASLDICVKPAPLSQSPARLLAKRNSVR